MSGERAGRALPATAGARTTSNASGETDPIQARIRKIAWFHSIDLGNGIVTPGVDNSPKKLLQIGLPTSLAGKSVLDIGAWDGFFSFEAERRGAERVVAVDSHSWGGGGWGSKEGFRCAREILGSRVEDVDLDVMDISAERLGTFDVVLFLGVLYHLRHPLLALERVLSVTKDLLILETHVDLLSTRRPAMAFYPGRELDGDMSNWWGPNPPALVKMLESAGFKRVQAIATPPSALVRFMKSVAKTPFRRTNPFVEMLNGRMVVHAHR